MIGDVRIFSNALSEDKIKEEMNKVHSHVPVVGVPVPPASINIIN